jgi:hypothetical protein
VHLRPLTDVERGQRLRELVTSRSNPEDLLEEIWRCREAGWSWQQVADVLGVTRQAAHKRFAHRLIGGQPTSGQTVRPRRHRSHEAAPQRQRPEPPRTAPTLGPSDGLFPELDELDVWPWETLGDAFRASPESS